MRVIVAPAEGGQNNPKIIVFGLFICVIDVLGLLKLFILVLLIKTQLLIPNLCLQDLAFKNFGQKRVKFCQKKRQGRHSGSVFTPRTLPKRCYFIIILFQTLRASICYFNNACGCLRSPEIGKIRRPLSNFGFYTKLAPKRPLIDLKRGYLVI